MPDLEVPAFVSVSKAGSTDPGTPRTSKYNINAILLFEQVNLTFVILLFCKFAAAMPDTLQLFQNESLKSRVLKQTTDQNACLGLR